MRHLIGVDLGGTNLKLGLFDYRLQIIDKVVLSTKSIRGKRQLIETIACSIKDIIRGRRLKNRDILGAGLGLPGPVDFKNGIVHFFPNIPGWKNVPLRKILKKRLGLAVYVDNDANLMALAEHRAGAAKGCRNAVCLTLGTGIGGGIIIENSLYRGSGFAAGEIGHIPINEQGPACSCQGKACIESYIGNRRIIRQAGKLFRRKVSLEELSALARDNDKKALALWKKVGARLGIALSGVVNLLNPDCLVIGGGVANAGRILFESVKKSVRERAMSPQSGQVRILKARLGEEAGMIGAALLVRDVSGANRRSVPVPIVDVSP